MARSDMVGLFWDDTPPPKPPKKEKEKKTPPPRTWESDDYLPNLQEALEFNVHVMNDYELYEALLNQERLVFDIECYQNYFLAGFASVDTGRVWFSEFRYGELLDAARLNWVLQNFCTIGFNTNSYDLPITALALAGRQTDFLKTCTNEIIVNNVPGSMILRNCKVKKLKKESGAPLDHIDLIEVAPSMCSLKLYGGRMGTQRMQDLPFNPDVWLNENQIAITRWYCLNDLSNTAMLYKSLSSEIKLRETMTKEYGIDLRSKSDAQIAEAVIAQEVGTLNGVRPQKPTIEIGTWYRYRTPYFLKYYSATMQWALNVVQNAIFVVGESGAVGMPPELSELEIKIGESVYRMGIGGLHSSEKSKAHYADANTILEDRDVTSYYPFIILNLGLYPQHLGPNFLVVYRQIVERRLSAKEGAKRMKKLLEDKGLGEYIKVEYIKEMEEYETISDSLKITINGSFGKLGSCYSVLYSPDLLIQVTVTGQLSLLMLIERLELSGISVVSANTDGIVIKCPKHLEAAMNAIVKQWEQETNFETEGVRYKAIYSRDVNNYIAVKEKGGAKTKGVYGDMNLKKNPQNQICSDAVVEFLTTGKPIAQSLWECRDIKQFATVRTVNGGAVKIWGKTQLPAHGTKEELLYLAGFSPAEGNTWRHPNYGENLANFGLDSAYETAKSILQKPETIEYLGKAIRWYYAKDVIGEIVYAKTGNKVSRSDGAKPMMDLPSEFPADLDYDWYEKEANKMLAEIGYGV